MSSVKADSSTTILVAESSPVHQGTVKELFDDFDFKKLTFVKDGFELTKAVQETRFDAILLDHNLNKANSLNAVAEIKKNGENTDTPIIFTYDGSVPAEEMYDLLRDIGSAGASASLSKPIPKEALREAVESALDKFIITKTEMEQRSKKSLAASETALALAVNLKEAGNFEHSEMAYVEAILNVLYGLAEVYLAGGKNEAFEEILREANLIDPQARDKFQKRTNDFLDRGNENLKRKKYRLAKFEFEAAAHLDENSVGAHVGLGEALLGLNEKKDALGSFRRVLEFKGEIENRHLYKRIGSVAFKLKEYDIAVRAYETALTFIRTDPELYYLQSLVYVAQWKFDEALASVNKALSLKTTFQEAQKAREKILAWVQAANEKENPVEVAT